MANNRLWLVTGTVVAALALTGCSGSASDSQRGGSRAPEAQYEGRPGKGGETRTDDDPQSTFAVDVDTASYGYAKRLLQEGRLPERGTVRPEEFINAFDQEYGEPRGDGFAVHVDGSRMPRTHRGATDLRLLRVGLQARADEATERRDAASTFVVDVSGSMAEPGRLDLVQDALHTLVTQLRATDSVAIVAFSSRPGWSAR